MKIFSPVEEAPKSTQKIRSTKKSFKVSDTVFAYVAENNKTPSVETMRAHKIESRIPAHINSVVSRVLHVKDQNRIPADIPAGVKHICRGLDKIGSAQDIGFRGPVGGKTHVILG